MNATQRETCAEQLLRAYETGEPIAPLSETFPDITFEDAYAIQEHQTSKRLESGRRILGHKIGLTSHAMRRQLGVDQPDYGILFDDMFHFENADIDTSDFVNLRVEPEIAFVLKRDLAGPGVTVAEAVGAIDGVLPALELIDSRIVDWRIGFFDTIADNASSGGVVLGSQFRKVEDLDLRLMGCVVRQNGEIVGTGAGGAVMGSPLNSLVWLANTLGARGISMPAGAVVLPGSITQSIPVSGGDVVSCTYSGLGSLTARFV